MSYISFQAVVKGAVTISQETDSEYISGSTLRGMLAGLWDNQTTGDQLFLDTFCRGKLRFWGLFPMPSDTEGDDFLGYNFFSYRMPLSAYSCKYHPGAGKGEHGYLNGLTANLPDTCPHPGCGAPLKQCKSPAFYYLRNQVPVPIKLKKETYLYHAADRQTKRAMDAHLYAYTSIASQERFIGFVSGDPACVSQLADRIEQQKNKGGLRLYPGRARKRRGFLKVDTHFNPERDAPDFYPHPVISGNQIMVVLQSPAILTNSLFRPKPTLDVEDIFQDLSSAYAITKEEREYTALMRIDAWSNIHRIFKNPETALAPGSAFLFSVGKMPDNAADRQAFAEELMKIQLRGIGERRLEGFGQIIINPPFSKEF